MTGTERGNNEKKKRQLQVPTVLKKIEKKGERRIKSSRSKEVSKRGKVVPMSSGAAWRRDGGLAFF